jgi:hypothetical protein
MKPASLIGALLVLAATGCGGGPASAPPTAAAPNLHMPVPPVLVTRPTAGAVVRRTLTVSGTASVSTFTIELLRGGKVTAKRTVRVTRRGTFAVTLDVEPGAVTIEALTRAPRDELDVPVTVSP